MTTVTPWRNELKVANKILKSEKYFLMDHRCRLRVNPKVIKNRLHNIELDGRWRGAEKDTSRRLFTKLNEEDITGSFERALSEAKELIIKGQIGEDTRRNLETYDRKPLQRLTLTQQAKREQALSFVRTRAENKGYVDRVLNTQEDWIDLCFAHVTSNKQQISIDNFAQALLMKYGTRNRKVYKDAIYIMKRVCEELNEPSKLSHHLEPIYKYVPDLRELPTDTEIAERIDAIKNIEEKKLVYAITVYGHRILHIYGTQWNKFNVKNGRVPFWSTKNNKQGVAIPCPFDDLHVDLSDWTPEDYEDLFVWGETPNGNLARKRANKSTRLSNLVATRLGVTATDMRHRYCSRSLLTGIHKNASECAASVGSSAAMIEKTYSYEIATYRLECED